jgi:hypothetical protein
LWRILYDNTLLLLETGLQIVSMDLTVAFHSIVLTNTGRPDEQQNRHLTDWRTSSASRLSAIMSRICTHSWTCWTRACALMVAMVLMGGNAHAHASPLQSACSALSAATGQRLRCPATLLARQRPTPEAGAGAPGVPGPAPLPAARPVAPRGQRELEQLGAVRGLLARLLPGHAGAFQLRLGLQCRSGHAACFEVAAGGGGVSVGGTTGAPAWQRRTSGVRGGLQSQSAIDACTAPLLRLRDTPCASFVTSFLRFCVVGA